MPTQPLDWITVRGYKSIAAIEKLQLRPINILIGPNGAGKSNVIGVFEFLSAVRAGRLEDTVSAAGGAERILHFGSKVTSEVRVSWSSGRDSEYALVLRPTAGDRLYPTDEVSSSQGASSQTIILEHSETGELRNSNPYLGGGVLRPVREVNKQIGRWRVYHFHDTSSSSAMRKTAALHDNRYLRPDGANLPALLYLFREQFPDEYRTIVGTVRQVAPFFDDFLLEPLELKPDSIRLEWKHKQSDQYFDASSLSDGTLRFIVLATLLLQPQKYRPSVILVDEPELGLHPAAIGILAALIQHASTDTQVIVSTQSSLLIDYFEPEDVLVAERREGGTQLRRLESSALESWLEEYSLGQLWEKGELGGRPNSE